MVVGCLVLEVLVKGARRNEEPERILVDASPYLLPSIFLVDIEALNPAGDV